MLYRKHICEPYFSLIVKGKKTVEGRLFRDEYALMKPGDQLVLYNDHDEEVHTLINSLQVFNSFQELLVSDLQFALPNLTQDNANTENLIQQGTAIYRNFYSESDELMFGVVSIHIKVDENARYNLTEI